MIANSMAQYHSGAAMTAMDSVKSFAVWSVVSTAVLIGTPSVGYADTAIETETAQIGKKGDFAVSQAYQYARATDGTSGESVTQFEYALSDRAEILVEPFFYTFDHPKGEKKSRASVIWKSHRLIKLCWRMAGSLQFLQRLS